MGTETKMHWNKKKYLLTVVSALIVLGLGLAAVLFFESQPRELSNGRGRDKNTSGLTDNHDLTRQDTEWTGIESSEQVYLGFNPSTSSTVNKPVKGTIQIQVDPADVSNLPLAINVYYLRPMFATAQEFISLSARFGVHGLLVQNRIRCGLLHTSYIESLDLFSFWDGGRSELKELNNVPSKDLAKKIAWRIAEDNGLLCPDAEIIATSESSMASQRTGNQLVVASREVVIGRKLDGYEVRGPGMQLRIKVGGDGKLHSISDCLRPVELLGSYYLKPLEVAFEEAQRGSGTVNLQTEAMNPTVKNVSILYYAEPARPENRVLFPVYAFTGPDCCIYVPAFGERISL